MATATLPVAESGRLTYEEYLTEGTVEGRYDILDGIRTFLPGQTWQHQKIAVRVLERLYDYERTTRSGKVLIAPFDILIRRAPLRTRQPDIFFITNARLAEAGLRPEHGFLTAGPNLIVEVLSPGESIHNKLTDLAEVGVREAWLVSPEAETVQVMRLSPERMETAATYGFDQTVISEAIPGLTVPVARIFED